ncbi:MAG: protein-glutamate O-methyltransferase family protein [Chloroflexi bacterium]|nr:protein-glutamate O-methyltransferase family protein [Chloroflexota bacterium]
MTQRPPMIRTDASNAFAHHTMEVRVPAIVREVITLNPDYPPVMQAALNRLADSMANDEPIPMLDLPAPDYDEWRQAYDHYTQTAGGTWQNTVWFFAETFAYRHVIQAVRWWETGRDPFLPKKQEEYAGITPWELLEQALSAEGSLEERLLALLDFDLWGNRIDLSFAAALAHGTHVQDDDLLVDDRPRIVEHLLRSDGAVHLVADNAGSELLMDFALLDLLMSELPLTTVLHLKLHPTFVSDATADDVRWLIAWLQTGQHGEHAAGLGQRMFSALQRGRLRLAPDGYWNSAYVLRDMPRRLTETFRGARLVLIKGDANYRRLAGDAIWPLETPFADMVSYFPAPVAALRTLKSDTLTGLPPGLAAQLDAADPDWRANGRRGVVQAWLG